jgi:putative ABC transport system substrate-binding protein
VLAEKRLQLLRELLPKAKSFALLVNPKSPVAEPQTRDAQAGAQALGLKLRVLTAVTENDLDDVFTTIVQDRTDALFVSADPFFLSLHEQLVALAARHAIPTLYEVREYVQAGGLMSYGTDLRDGYHKGGIYAGRILKGVKPAELPVEQINKLEFVVNGKTAKALGLDIPPQLLALADEVIE